MCTNDVRTLNDGDRSVLGELGVHITLGVKVQTERSEYNTVFGWTTTGWKSGLQGCVASTTLKFDVNFVVMEHEANNGSIHRLGIRIGRGGLAR